MAICAVFDNPGQTAEHTDGVLGALRATGPVPPTGATYVLGGAHDGGWRMISVWESEEAMDRFFETRLPQAMAEVGVDAERHSLSSFEIYKQAIAGSEAAPAL